MISGNDKGRSTGALEWRYIRSAYLSGNSAHIKKSGVSIYAKSWLTYTVHRSSIQLPEIPILQIHRRPETANAVDLYRLNGEGLRSATDREEE